MEFGEIEPLINHPYFGRISYLNQDSVLQEQTASVLIGASHTLSATISGLNNTYQWYKRNYFLIGGFPFLGTPVLINGATDSIYQIPSFSANDRGVYLCEIKNTLITNQTLSRRPITVVEQTVTSTNTPSSATQDIIIYPTITTRNVQIKANLTTPNDHSIQVYDMTGKELYHKSLPNSSSIQETVNLSTLTSGIYFISISNAQKILFSQKIIKQ